ncbi:MAG: hypothetical protein M1824_005528 [Vezdaea acicularis]|nr:MAG: hypothetical protein M1824_005528 [Vezdaea acicularis]
MEKIRIPKIEDVQILRRGVPVSGTLHLTPHHLIFSHTPSTPQDEDTKAIARPKEIWITYPIISLCTFRPSPPASGLSSSVRLRCRDFTFVTFHFSKTKEARDVYESIKGLTCKVGRVEKLYAFSYRPQHPEKDCNGWEIYDARQEWRRLGISEKDTDKGWRVSNINSDYKFSPSYPSLLLVPNSISDNVLNYAVKFRSRGRLPVLTYLHPTNNCSLTRSSQPHSGLRNNRSVQDEKLVAAIFSSSDAIQTSTLNSASFISESGTSSTSKSILDSITPESSTTTIEDPEAAEDILVHNPISQPPEDKPRIYGSQRENMIVDARPQVNALAMQAVGLGTENRDNYDGVARQFLNIENIHVMRESLSKVIEAIKDADITPLPPNRELLAKSDWLKHIKCLLTGADVIARQIALQHSHVLLHCSDGWDRTSQLSALSQICLDPYYRTLEGFIVLVEKDWLSFGHMFRHRSGFLGSEKWFVTQNEGLGSGNGSSLSGGSSPFGNRIGGANALENALLSAKGFFNKDNNSRDSVDSDGEPGALEGSPRSKRRTTSPNGRGDTTNDHETTKVKETSPVFHQFLDCTYQLLYQYPTRFEFNERFLKRLLYHLYSCQYGTFLYNSERERVEASVAERTRSVWDYFLARREMFLNPNYADPEFDARQREENRLIFPRVGEVRWWSEVFGRTDEEMNGAVLSTSRLQHAPPADMTSSMTGSERGDRAPMPSVGPVGRTAPSDSAVKDLVEGMRGTGFAQESAKGADVVPGLEMR